MTIAGLRISREKKDFLSEKIKLSCHHHGWGEASKGFLGAIKVQTLAAKRSVFGL
jgi:hypothetical protein